MQLIDAKAAAPLLGLKSKTSVYEAARRGLVPCIRVGRRMRFDPDVLRQWAASGGTSSKAMQPKTTTT